MINTVLALVLANVLAIGADAILRSIFRTHIPNQYWICLNLAWVCVYIFSRKK